MNTKELFHGLDMTTRARLERILRAMSMGGMGPFDLSGTWPQVDVYETGDSFVVWVDVAGADPEQLSVVVDDTRIRVTGRREPPADSGITCVHQLEIERGEFDRIIPLPGLVDVGSVSSSYQRGMLRIKLPKRTPSGRIRISIEAG